MLPDECLEKAQDVDMAHLVKRSVSSGDLERKALKDHNLVPGDMLTIKLESKQVGKEFHSPRKIPSVSAANVTIKHPQERPSQDIVLET